MKHYGLTDEQVLKSKNQYGDNSLSELKREGFWKKLAHNFTDPMIKILCVALLINILCVALGQAHWYEAVGIAIAVILATFVSTFSEYKNEDAFKKLQAQASKIICKVFRNGDITEMPIDYIVTGDLVLLQLGDKIPADGIIIDGRVKVDQSVLNGETKEAQKKQVAENYIDGDSGIDFLNEYKIFRGSVVCEGNAVMQATNVGDNSVYGKLAGELQIDDDRDTPLKVKLKQLARGISKFGYMGGIAIAVALLFQRIFVYNSFDMVQISLYFSDWLNVLNDVLQAVILAVTIIVMAVPEGLPLMIAIVSALNMRKMLKDNVLVRKIAGIETAGSLNILYTDKTGTITKGLLEAVVFIDGEGGEHKSLGEVSSGLKNILSINVHNNTDALISGEGNDINIIGGNATERAILRFVREKAEVNIKKIASLPFNSANKYSATQVEGDFNGTLIKGAPEKILARCKYFFDKDGNKCEFGKGDLIESMINSLAARAIRVLALAVCDAPLNENEIPDGEFTLIGVMGIRDDVRPESITAIAEVMGAGVQVVMITGDRLDTAVAIATEAGLLRDKSDIVLTSQELNNLSDDEIKQLLPNLRVIARALPSDKSRLVRISQELNLVVGMTGDGVNDSPALKKADVGFAMGGGTEVAKEASEIVIMDDNFNSIDKAILYGRTIYNNIRKFVVFQLTINVAAVLISFVSPLLSIPVPLTITQILWINLVIDTLAALAFGGEAALARYMKERPKKRSDSIVSKTMWGAIITDSVWVFAVGLFLLLSPVFSGIFRGEEYLLTGFFVYFVFAAVFNSLNTRTDQINLFDNMSKNKGFLEVMGFVVLMQVIMTYLGGVVLNCFGLTANEWLVVLLLSVTIIPIDIIRKVIVKRKNKLA